VLAKYELDEFLWGLEERSLAERLTAIPRPGSIHEDWERELDAALAARARPEEDAIIARDYAELKVALENEPAHDVLGRAKLTLGGWMRLEKKWQRAMHEDLGVRAEIEGRVSELRERAEHAPDGNDPANDPGDAPEALS
jgi:hypothetical protein